MVVVPIGKKSPDATGVIGELGGVFVREITMLFGQLSVKIGSIHVTAAPQRPASLFLVMEDGQLVTVGPCVSVTCNVNAQGAETWPSAPVATATKEVLPGGKVNPSTTGALLLLNL